ncbi:MAG: bifunctional adenosylcobinamide kinase/adenosylcobinamide-phosphate guanylyltransferase [Chitinivibrionales bacterium]
MGKVTLVSGGARCGKSEYSLELAQPYTRRFFIATAIAFDDEMTVRIENHQRQRGDRYETIEEPWDLVRALQSVSGRADIAVVDCLTVWMGNLFFRHEQQPELIDKYLSGFVSDLKMYEFDLILVTNEVGWGIIPDNATARMYRDYAGRLNSQVATLADSLILMVCGQPLYVKGS